MTDRNKATRRATRARRVAVSALFYTGVWIIASGCTLPVILLFIGSYVGWTGSAALAALIGAAAVAAGIITADRTSDGH